MWEFETFCCGFGWWWIFPVVMMLMFALCFLMMMRRGRFMRCGPFPQSSGDSFWNGRAESALDILDKRYAGGEIDKDEYEARKRDLNPTEG